MAKVIGIMTGKLNKGSYGAIERPGVGGYLVELSVDEVRAMCGFYYRNDDAPLLSPGDEFAVTETFKKMNEISVAREHLNDWIKRTKTLADAITLECPITPFDLKK
jgi:hypothetical protein